MCPSGLRVALHINERTWDETAHTFSDHCLRGSVRFFGYCQGHSPSSEAGSRGKQLCKTAALGWDLHKVRRHSDDHLFNKAPRQHVQSRRPGRHLQGGRYLAGRRLSSNQSGKPVKTACESRHA